MFWFCYLLHAHHLWKGIFSFQWLNCEGWSALCIKWVKCLPSKQNFDWMQFTYQNIHNRERDNWVLSWRYFETMLSIVQRLAEVGIKNNQLNEKIIVGQVGMFSLQRDNEDHSTGLWYLFFIVILGYVLKLAEVVIVKWQLKNSSSCKSIN